MPCPRDPLSCFYGLGIDHSLPRRLAARRTHGADLISRRALDQVQNGNRSFSKDLQDVAEVVRLPTPQASTRILTNSATKIWISI